jgi:hypothetical protein
LRFICNFLIKELFCKTCTGFKLCLGVSLKYSLKLLALLVITMAIMGGPTAWADTPVTLLRSFAGNINITGTAGTLRTEADGISSCSVTNSGSMQLLGVPTGSTIVVAYIYCSVHVKKYYEKTD